MNKDKLFLRVFAGISVIRLLLSIYFGECFLFRHIWLVYLAYFLIIGIVIFDNYPVVPLKQKVRRRECIMLGDGTMTEEKFDRGRFPDYKLVSRSGQGMAYASWSGEMIYTRFVQVKAQGGETVFSLVTYIFFYTCVGLYSYYMIAGIVDGTIDMEIPVHVLKENLKTLNLLSDRYPVRNNMLQAVKCILDLWHAFCGLVSHVYQLVTG